MSKPGEKSRLSRRTFGVMGLAGLGATTIGPGAALAGPPALQEQSKRAPKFVDRRSRGSEFLPPVEGLSVVLTASPDEGGVTIRVAILNSSSHSYDLVHPKWGAPPPDVTVRAFGDEYTLALKLPESVRRRAFMSRMIPIETISLAARGPEDEHPSRTHFGVFRAAWPGELDGRIDALREARVELVGSFLHPSLREHGLDEPLPTNLVVLDWDPPKKT